jgi:C-terminal processing protease CtpA/Prc
MRRLILPALTLFAVLAVVNAQYNETVVIPSPEADGTATTVMLNMAGISAVVRKEKETEKVMIVQVLPEGAAEKAGLLAKDIIIKIDDKQIDGLDIQAVAAMLRGDPGTTVKVTIVRAAQSAPSDFTVTRELVRLKEVPSK